MKNNFFSFIRINGKPVSGRPGTDAIYSCWMSTELCWPTSNIVSSATSMEFQESRLA